MNDNVRITVLIENSVRQRGLAAEHGLCIHVQLGSRSLLFDTGQTGLVLANARALGIDLRQVDAVLLSHGHNDHTGGLPWVLGIAPNARVFLHPGAYGEKFSGKSGPSRFLGMSREAVIAVRGRRDVVETTGWTEVLDGAFVTGEIPRANTFEDTGGSFFLDAECTRPDPLADDQALVIDIGRSIVLLLGCAHAGVVNTMDYVERSTGKPVRALVGGLHLASASDQRVAQTISRLRAAKLDCLAPVHCTGWPATARLWHSFPTVCRSAGVGTILEFPHD